MDDGIYLNSSHQDGQEILDVTPRLYSLLGLERNGGTCFSAGIDPEGEQNPNLPREKPYISTWVDRDSTSPSPEDIPDTDGGASKRAQKMNHDAPARGRGSY